jgi:hypothetical protein
MPFSLKTGFVVSRRYTCMLQTIIKPKSQQKKLLRGEKAKMLSRDCDGCELLEPCVKRYHTVNKGEKVYCPDGTAHLVDQNQ